MTDIPENPIFGGVEDFVEGHGQLDDA